MTRQRHNPSVIGRTTSVFHEPGYSMPNNPSPEVRLAANDPGDDTLERYRYQITYTAILGLSLLDEPSEHEYLYCEHHEDVLLKRIDGYYCGIQIKTQGEGYEPFKSGDDPIRNSIRRFRDLDAAFPGCFHQFALAANCGFWREKKDKSNLAHVVSLAREDTTPRPAALMAILRRFDADATKHSGLISILKKVELQHDLPHIKDIDGRLVSHLSQIDALRQHDYGTLTEIGNRLVARIFQASSHACVPKFKDYCAVLKFPTEAHALAVIAGKRIGKETVAGIIADSIARNVAQSRSNNVSRPSLPASLSRLEKRMAAGYISVEDVEVMSDLTRSAETRFAQWLSKYGPTQAGHAYDRLRVAIWNECREAQTHHEVTIPYGPAMLTDVRLRLRNRAGEFRGQVYDCDYELLLGFVGILTQEGKVWWSPKFEEEED